MRALAFGLLLLLSVTPAEGRRVALVIGNDSYQYVEPLHNARADAKAVATSLQNIGFAVTLKQDTTLSAMKAALRSFKAQVSGGDEVVFYFSGHGVQFEGLNYLIPVDLAPQNEEQVADDSVSLQRVLDNLSDQKARFTLAIIDACRDNPFKGTGRAIGKRGLAPVTAATGQMVLYSAGAGQEALDRLGPNDADPNGVFTRVFIKEIKKPGVPADRILKNVRDQVVRLAKSMNHEQVPALYDQTIGEFYFLEPQSPTARLNPDDDAWSAAREDGSVAAYRSYLEQFPAGTHAATAKVKLASRMASTPETVRQSETKTPAPTNSVNGTTPATAAGTVTPARPPTNGPAPFELPMEVTVAGAHHRATTSDPTQESGPLDCASGWQVPDPSFKDLKPIQAAIDETVRLHLKARQKLESCMRGMDAYARAPEQHTDWPQIGRQGISASRRDLLVLAKRIDIVEHVSSPTAFRIGKKPDQAEISDLKAQLSKSWEDFNSLKAAYDAALHR